MEGNAIWSLKKSPLEFQKRLDQVFRSCTKFLIMHTHGILSFGKSLPYDIEYINKLLPYDIEYLNKFYDLVYNHGLVLSVPKMVLRWS